MTFLLKIASLINNGFFFLIVSFGALHAEGTKTLILGDAKANRVNMVFLAEGYTQAEQSKFVDDVRENIGRFFLCKPWVNYKSLCNVYAIGVVSAESGSDHPNQGINRNTYFESTFGTSTERWVGLGSAEKVPPLLAEHVPDYDFICVLVNDPQYGGSGGVYSVVTLSTEATLYGRRSGY